MEAPGKLCKIIRGLGPRHLTPNPLTRISCTRERLLHRGATPLEEPGEALRMAVNVLHARPLSSGGPVYGCSGRFLLSRARHSPAPGDLQVDLWTSQGRPRDAPLVVKLAMKPKPLMFTNFNN